MALFVQSTNSIGPGVRVLLSTTSDTLIVLPGFSIASTDTNDAVSASVASESDVIQNNGIIVGYDAIFMGATPSTLNLLNNASGVIEGSQGFGVSSLGTVTMTNYGQIEGAQGGATMKTGTVYNYGSITAQGFGGLFFANQGTVANFGTISGAQGVVFGANATGNSLYNAGTIRADTGISDQTPSAASTDTFFNAGTIVSVFNSFTSASSPASSISFTNAGSMIGNVNFGNGGANLFDSTFGQVFGTIFGAGGADTIVAGNNGGIVSGGGGNDVLYANPTLAAAANAAKTTLNGGAGINALYGDGAFTTFIGGTSLGGYNQIWGGASQMAGVSGYTNNTLSFAGAAAGVYVDLLNGHNAYIGSSAGQSWTGPGVFEDSIINVPNVVGSAYGDLLRADTGTDRITGFSGADSLYAASGQDTFVYNAYSDSNLVTGYDTIVAFKLGIDKIDLAAMHTDASHLAISTNGTSNTLYVEQTPGMFNANTDLALIVNTSAAGGLHASDFVF